MQSREYLRTEPKLNEAIRSVVVVCFKLLMGVPWHAFPPEVLPWNRAQRSAAV
jgi:hypothetical protein